MKQGGFLKQTTQLKSGGYLNRSSKPIRKHRLASPGQWSEKTTDDKFSFVVRKRDGKCLRCKSTYNLTCSHFHGRGHSATRFDPKNCDTFCVWCHEILETKKQPGQEYYEWKLNQLGEMEFHLLARRSAQSMPKSESIKRAMEELSKIPLQELDEIKI